MVRTSVQEGPKEGEVAVCYSGVFKDLERWSCTGCDASKAENLEKSDEEPGLSPTSPSCRSMGEE